MRNLSSTDIAELLGSLEAEAEAEAEAETIASEHGRWVCGINENCPLCWDIE